MIKKLFSSVLIILTLLMLSTSTLLANEKIESGNMAVTFTKISSSLQPIRSGSSVWGDYDNDGDLDILMTGLNDPTYYTKLYRNNGNGTFTAVNSGLPPVAYGNTMWGDHDNDGDLDVLLSGWDGSVNMIHVYENRGNDTFVRVATNISAPGYLEAAWGDADSDGDLDILVAGLNNSNNPTTYLYLNDGAGRYTYKPLSLSQHLYDGSIQWGDYDNDGDNDFLLTGRTSTTLYSILYRNDGNYVFTDIHAGFQGVYTWSSTPFGDYDNDGDLDVVLSGQGSISNSSTRYTKLYRNDGNDKFTEVNANLKPSKQGSLAWGDYDNDGDLDIFLSGFDGYNDHTKLYRNDGNDNFSLQYDSFVDAVGSCNWGDYDNDGDLDLLITGWDGGGNHFYSEIYRNDGATPNTKPTAPDFLGHTYYNGSLILSWNEGSDEVTPSGGLSYNLRVGTTPGGDEICAGHAGADGYRLIPALGNVQMNRIWTLQNIQSNATYYCAVQSIDGNFAGSEWLNLTVTLGEAIYPTNEWINFYSSNSVVHGQPLPVGSVIRAYDPDSTLCGSFTVTTEGEYGFLVVYRDDALTPTIDEGAVPGDTVSFTIDGVPAAAIGPESAIWTDNGDAMEVDLVVTKGDPTPVVPTNAWVNFYGNNTMLESEPIPEGSVIDAYDPDGVHCGTFTVTTPGEYGFLLVYQDDPSTADVDEGASPNDEILFKINRIPARIVGPSENIWTSNGALIELDLKAPNHAPEVIASIEDQYLHTDTQYFIVADLDTVFSDSDGDALTFSSGCNETSVNHWIDDSNQLLVTIKNNWQGQVDLVITAKDDWYSANTIVKLFVNPTGIEQSNFDKITPEGYVLEPNYPNPFNPETQIRFGIPEAGSVEISVFNIRGQKIRSLMNGHLQAGWYSLKWDGLDELSRSVGSGVYVLKMTSGNFVSNIKMMLIR